MEWISVKDRLPDNTRDVLVTDGEDYSINYFSQVAKEFCFTEKGEYNKSITYWMELPPIPTTPINQ